MVIRRRFPSVFGIIESAQCKRSVPALLLNRAKRDASPVEVGRLQAVGASAVWTFSCVFQSPAGRTENSPGLEAWEYLRKENRPERASDFWALFPKGRLRQKPLDGIPEKKSAGTIRCERDWAQI